MGRKSRVAGRGGRNHTRGALGRRRSGFTMVELIVATSILLLATAAAFGSQLASFGMIDSSRDASVAMNDLEACMEQVLTQSADNIPLRFPAGERIAGFNELHLRGQVVVPSYPNYAGAGDVPDPLDIVLTSTWLDGRGRPQLLTLSTQVTR